MCVWVCVRTPVSAPNNFWMPQPIFMKFGTSSEPILTAYFIHPSHQYYQHYSLSNCWVALMWLDAWKSEEWRQKIWLLLSNSLVNLFPRHRNGHVSLFPDVFSTIFDDTWLLVAANVQVLCGEFNCTWKFTTDILYGTILVSNLDSGHSSRVYLVLLGLFPYHTSEIFLLNLILKLRTLMYDSCHHSGFANL
jgi:hypothetical protein